MRLIENMTLDELNADLVKQKDIIDKANFALNKIHGQNDYSDEVAKHFHLGKVGFRKDAKKQARTLNKAINNGVKACGHYDKIRQAENRLKSLQKAIDFVTKYDTAMTVHCIKEQRKADLLNTASCLNWIKIKGHYGAAYQYDGYIVERCDTNFVTVRDLAGNLITHCKTVKEAKVFVTLSAQKTA